MNKLPDTEQYLLSTRKKLASGKHFQVMYFNAIENCRKTKRHLTNKVSEHYAQNKFKNGKKLYRIRQRKMFAEKQVGKCWPKLTKLLLIKDNN